MASDVVSKGKFAELKNVTPGRVSQWIKDKQLSGEALVGEGRRAQIRVSIANTQLKRKLDIVQRVANGLDTKLDAMPGPDTPPTAPQALPLDAPAQPKPIEVSDLIEEQIKRGRLETLQRQNRKLAEEEAARSGRYLDAEDAAQQMGRIAGQMLTVFEGSLTELATALSAKFSLPQRDVLHLLRAEFRTIRERAASSLKQAAAERPTLIADEVETEGETEAVEGE